MSPITTKKFPSECNPRGVVKTADKVLIYNSDTGASDEFSTVGELTKIQDDAITDLDNTKEEKVTGKGLSTNDYDDAAEAEVAKIAGKINTSDIANNLTETVSGKVLDATQGKVLDDKILASQGNLLGGIAYNASAPTPAVNGRYVFTSAGSCTWITGGAVTVAINDEVLVTYTAPSTYTYIYLNVGTNFLAKSGGTMTGSITSVAVVNPLITAAESWIGPSATEGVYFKGGNVGIGTTAPNAKLEVAGGIRTFFSGQYFGDLTNTDGNTKLFANGDQGKLIFGNAAYGSFWDRMTITYDGNVGIGTTTPNYKLELGSDSAGKPGAGGLWTVVSDARIKKDIELADLDICYETIKNIPLKRYAWADGVYSEQQVKDRHNLGWIAQDVQKYFSKAVSVIPFTKNEKIEDGVEEYQEQEFELVDKEVISVEIINGKPIQVKKIIQEKVLLFDSIEVLDENGKQVFTDKENITPLLHQVPKMETKTRAKFRQEVIEDCLDLNSGQLYAAMYGALQKAIEKIEFLEKEVALLKL